MSSVDGGGSSNIALRDDSIENHKHASDSAGIAFHYVGYGGGTTYFRNFNIYNGKQSLIGQFTGSNGNFAFNSGYGSAATAYGCRVWVNFNGSGTVAIRASGNVSSITDTGTGDYTVNFTNAMPDSNYAIIIKQQNESSGNLQSPYTVKNTTGFNFYTTQYTSQMPIHIAVIR